MPVDVTSASAVIDIGSNSGRVVVVRREYDVHLHVLGQERVPLRLARSLNGAGGFDDRAIERTVQAVRDFAALAERAGAETSVAVGTFAVRSASNGQALADAVERATGVALRILPADEEAALSFRGAVHGLDAEGGIAIDVGGGSLEVTRFRRRVAISTRSLPFGAIVATKRYLRSDPPTDTELEQLREALLDELGEQRPLKRGEVLVATGGSIRNLAKLDRERHTYPLERLHGYELDTQALAETVASLAARTTTKRARVQGIKRDRVDSIVAGGLVVQVVAEAVGASVIHVSGQGLREGIALEALEIPAAEPNVIRAASVDALDARLVDRIPGSGERRADIVLDLARATWQGASEHQLELLGYAARLLDVGAAIDPYAATRATLAILSGAELIGFSHRSLAMLCAMVAASDGSPNDVPGLKTLLDPTELVDAKAGGALLALSHELERRLPPRAAKPAVRRSRGKTHVAMRASGDRIDEVVRKVAKHCGIQIVFTEGGT